MSNTITISRTEYRSLRKQAEAFRKFAGKVFEAALSGNIDDVVTDFRNTNLYSDEFLKDLESGLKKSSYAKR